MVWHLQYSEYSGIAIVFCIAPSIVCLDRVVYLNNEIG